MIYLVTKQQELLESDLYKIVSVDESLSLMESWKMIQFDTETKGVDAHISPVLCAQFGNRKEDVQIVVDATTIDLKLYKSILETKLVIGQNLYFDLQFMYNYGIVCLNVYDTMIVEQLLHLGYPPVSKGGPSMSLASIADRRLGIYIDKSIRGQIIWRGLDSSVIQYAAKDVVYLEDIMWSQVQECKDKNCLKAAQLECSFVPVMAYTSWCGIKLDTELWKEKMRQDEETLHTMVERLNEFVLQQNNPKFIYVNRQGDLFEGWDLKPKSKVVWAVPGIKAPKGNKELLISFVQTLGFDTKTLDKKTKSEKDTIDLKALQKQKGIDDAFLSLYTQYSAAYKVVSTYGVTYLNAINPLTGRMHTSFKQLGADTGRITCGNGEEEERIKINPDLAKLKGYPIKTDDTTKICGYPNIQTLPSDELTRKCFVAEKGNVFCSCDWSAIESRLGADIYHEQAMLDEFLHGSGDMHSLVAWMVFRKECEERGCKSVADVKKLAPDYRKRAKPVEFSQQFGGSAEAIRNSMGCPIEEAQTFADAYNNGFKGIAEFKKKGSAFVKQNGYILLNPVTGHKTYWWDFRKWKDEAQNWDNTFWEDYRANHKGVKGDPIAMQVSMHFKVGSKWDRKALNSVTQGTGAICFKTAARAFFEWIIHNNLFTKVKIVDLVHDELCIEYPKELKDTAQVLEIIMEDAAAIYCKSLPIPAEAEVSDHWVH